MSTASKEHDDLTQISGIAEARQHLLQTSLDVYTFQDLVDLTVEEIQSALKAEGHSVSPNTIQTWLIEAHQRASTTKQTAKSSENPAATKKHKAPAQGGKWKTSAAFIVEFQALEQVGKPEGQRTKIHHVQSGEEEKWPYVDGHALMQWMLSQRKQGSASSTLTPKVAKQPIPEPKSAPIEQQKPGGRKPIKGQINQVKIYQPIDTHTPMIFRQADQLFSGNVRGDKLFSLEASFELGDVSSLASYKTPAEYQIGFSVDDRATGANIHLGSTKPKALQKGFSSYAARLEELKLRPGTYRLKVLVTLQAPCKKLMFLEIPLLQVM